MVDSKRYDPTITRFRKHTQSFVSNKTKKGHLNKDERDTGDVIKEEGTLVSVDRNNLNGKTWKVKVGNKIYDCTYGDNIVYLPECTEQGNLYKPKKECKVEVSIDKKSKIYTITRIEDPNKQPIAMIDNQISLQGQGEASLTVGDDKVSATGDIEIDTSDKEGLPDSISVTELYKKVQIIESKISDGNDG